MNDKIICIDCSKEFIGIVDKEDTCPNCLKRTMKINELKKKKNPWKEGTKNFLEWEERIRQKTS